MQSIEEILKRNSRVEQDKAWETSLTRRAFIAGITFLVAAVFMYRIGVEAYILNACIPTGGYLLSTLSLPPIKRWWLRRRQDANTTDIV
jgi:uncharacterized membrane protein